MKIAVVTDDEKTVSQHFGRAPYYLVVTIQDGRIAGRERRDKPGHAQFGGRHRCAEDSGHGRGMGVNSSHKHSLMAAAIADCEAVICGGMGQGAYNSLQACGIKPVITDILGIDEAVAAYAAGTIVNLTERLH